MKKILLFTALSFLSLAAGAVSDPCVLLPKALPAGLNMSSAEIQSYRQKLNVECGLTRAYREARSALKEKYNLTPENLTEYEAMRFVRRVDYENSRVKEIPVELTYQILRSSYNLPNSQKSPVIWDNWVVGIRQLVKARAQVQQGKAFDFESLRRVHVGFFTLSEEVGDDAHAPDEGRMKAPNDNDNYWWEFNTPKETEDARRIVDAVNADYRAMGLLPNLPDAGLNRVLAVKKALKRQPEATRNKVEYVDVIFAGDTRANRILLDNILNFVNLMLAKARKNQPLLWKGKLYTPAQIAFFAQKFYVGVHPFSEGNGRTSRFLQELILTSFDMPHGSSGDLMDSDILSTNEDYYRLAVDSSVRLMSSVSACLKEYESKKPADFSYNCRILKVRQ